MSHQRRIVLTETGQELAQIPQIQAAVEAVCSNEEDYPGVDIREAGNDDVQRTVDERIQALVQQDCYKALTPEEQYQSQIIGVAENGWRMTGQNDSNALFPTPAIIEEYPLLAHDQLLLSGITIEDLHLVKAQEILEQSHIYGFPDKLRLANFIGAVILSEEPYSDPNFPLQRPGQFTVQHDAFVNKTTTVGGNIHGDFMMWQYTQYTGESIDPIGNEHYFSPIDAPAVVRAYHSVEPSLAVAALKHLHQFYSRKDQKEIIEEIARQAKGIETSQEANFGDFGGDGEDIEILLMQNELEEGTAANGEDKVWTNLSVNPGHRYILRVESKDGLFTLRNTYVDNPYISDKNTTIQIPTSSVANFLLSLLHQSHLASGRTAPAQVANVLQARYDMLRDAK